MNKVTAAVTRYIQNAFSELDPKSFSQEPAYVAALMGRLRGVAWEDDDGTLVKFKTTVIDDRGPKSAESRFGADFAISLEMTGRDYNVSKAVFGQGKRGKIEKLRTSEKRRLDEQCSKMSKHTKEYLILETPMISGASPMVRLRSDSEITPSGQQISLQNYIVEMFIACKHGDKRPSFVSAVQESNLSQLSIIVEGLDPNLIPDSKPRHKPRF
ncbi:MAG: hypothetical protein F8N36_13125 [Desulfovibrio sp.]|uniref:hypothetical protein n=1 Tax=Desulfovibrio sp. TaxID=885 RepID=UPI00135D2B06|nr:hypothetical protein [Desulfovibrio sp.]MTJ93783.1 hypothetical protein [Desulfovibrio sp.]